MIDIVAATDADKQALILHNSVEDSKKTKTKVNYKQGIRNKQQGDEKKTPKLKIRLYQKKGDFGKK